MQENLTGAENLNLRADGQLDHLGDWNMNVAHLLAKREDLVLTDAHISIIKLMRDYYAKYNISPIRKLLKKEISEKLGKAKADDQYLCNLFPLGLCEQGSRIAGLPKPSLDMELRQANPLRLVGKGRSTSHYLSAFEFNGKTYDVYTNGNLKNLSDWSEVLAEHLAEKEGIKLNKDHWEVLHYMRDFYNKYGISPMVRLLMKHMRLQLGKRKSSEAYLYDLFPGGPSRQGSRIAGLPAPQGCIDP